MPTIHRIGATWSFGIQPVFIGDDRNFERQTDANIDHVRSFAGSLYRPVDHAQSQEWMAAALREAEERLRTEGKRRIRNSQGGHQATVSA